MMTSEIDPRSKRDQVQRRFESLRNERITWEAQWRELCQYTEPGRERLSTWAQSNRGGKLEQKIVNNTAGRAGRTLASGMMAGLTTPAREWVRLNTHDPELAETSGTRAYLDTSQQRIMQMFARSNIYTGLHDIYGDLGHIATAVGVVDEDAVDGIRLFCIPVGEYYLATDDRGVVDTLGRKRIFTVRQLVQRFGLPNCSSRTREMYAAGKYEDRVPTIHVIEPRAEFDPRKADPQNMPWASTWIEENADADSGVLAEKGYQESPILAPRWSVTGSDVYGKRSPGMTAMGDIKALQLYERRKAQVVDRISNPPMVGPAELKNRPGSITEPGSFTWLSQASGGIEVKAAVMIPPGALEAIEASIRSHEQRIQSEYFADLWLMLSQEQDSGQPITAREVQERHEEKMLQLGPVMERLETDLLKPLIERAFGIASRRGLLPPPPPELHGQELGIEYLSIMATAQKMVGMGSIQQTTSYALELAEGSQDMSVLDKVDMDKAISLVADAVGAPNGVIRTDDEVAQRRATRAKQQAQAQAAQQGLLASQAAKNLGQAKVGQDSALGQAVGGVAAAQAEDQQ